MVEEFAEPIDERSAIPSRQAGSAAEMPIATSKATESRIRLAFETGRQRFMDVELEVTAGALIPRDETELLGKTAVTLLNSRGINQRAIDMGCGSGNLACGIAFTIESLHLWASDLTDQTVQLARRNVVRLGLESRVTVLQGDLFEGMVGLALDGTIDAIVCNPPYISTNRLAKDRAHLLQHEPREAFDGGPYGLSIHQRVIKDAVSYLKPDGWLLFEIGLGQEKQVEYLFRRSGAYGSVQFIHDAMNAPRVAFAQKAA